MPGSFHHSLHCLLPASFEFFLSSAKHWFSSSSNSFLNTPKLMWSPGTQTWNREPFSLVSCMSLFKAIKWTLIGAENGLSYLLFWNECLYFQLKKIFYYLATCFEFNELVRIYSDSSAHWAKGSTHFKKKNDKQLAQNMYGVQHFVWTGWSSTSFQIGHIYSCLMFSTNCSRLRGSDPQKLCRFFTSSENESVAGSGLKLKVPDIPSPFPLVPWV